MLKSYKWMVVWMDGRSEISNRTYSKSTCGANNKNNIKNEFQARVKPENSAWFEDANLKNLIVCQPDNRNIYNKIYGGFIMRQAFELAWANSFVFCKSRPTVLHMDDILFRTPVEVGAMLYFNSQVCFTLSHVQ